MEQIINEQALLEDSIEGIANILDCYMMEIDIPEHEMKAIMDAMFEAQSIELYRIAGLIKRDKVQ